METPKICRGCHTYNLQFKKNVAERYHCPIIKKEIFNICVCKICILKPMCGDSCMEFVDFIYKYKIISLHEYNCTRERLEEKELHHGRSFRTL